MNTNSPERKQLSFTGKADIFIAVLSVVSTTIWSALTGFGRSERDAPSLLLHIGYASLRKATRRLSALQLQSVNTPCSKLIILTYPQTRWISPSTDKLYETYVRSQRVTPETVELGCHGARGHWLGNKDAKHVLIWYHGGGFCLPANVGYFKFLDDLVKSSSAMGKDFAVFVLTYTLAPQAHYPTQLTQAVEALRFIVSETDRRPSEIFLGGDSAGGNLAIGVLSHLAHPHPEIAKVELGESLAGVAVIAPWTSLDESNSDKKEYSGGDVITPYVGRPWSRHYLGGVTRDYYTDASNAPSTWFETYPVMNILVLCGGNEIMRSTIEEFATKLKVSHSIDTFRVTKKHFILTLGADWVSSSRTLCGTSRGTCCSGVQPLCGRFKGNTSREEVEGMAA